MERITERIDAFNRSLERVGDQLDGFRTDLADREEALLGLIDAFGARISTSAPVPKGELAALLAAAFNHLSAGLVAWTSAVRRDISGREFINRFERSVIVTVYGKVKSGKSSLGNFIAGVDRDAPVDPTEAWIRQAERALDVDAGNLRQYEQVQGVTMWTGTNAVGARCIIVAWGELWGNGSCTPAPLDPVVDFRVNPDIPMPLAAPLDEGGVVRFVARGDVVEIWVREPTDTGSDLSAS